ncbi:complexin-2 [Chakrabartyella piscis]|uniref:complexin-2 n=1 Tax=Chakrabartyella piscis TaxID=2918914 RepID=UPI0029584211|nr:complexin-2 [Chakrabartyella piscis]
MKNIQISYELFLMLVKCHLADDATWNDAIQKELNRKMEAVTAREVYTRYKTADTKEEQENARLKYLDLKARREDFCR